LTDLGHTVSNQTAGNILRRHGIAPVPEKSQPTTWRDFIRRHMDVLAGTDFITVEVLTGTWTKWNSASSRGGG
jgi:putative transposase